MKSLVFLAESAKTEKIEIAKAKDVSVSDSLSPSASLVEEAPASTATRLYTNMGMLPLERERTKTRYLSLSKGKESELEKPYRNSGEYQEMHLAVPEEPEVPDTEQGLVGSVECFIGTCQEGVFCQGFVSGYGGNTDGFDHWQVETVEGEIQEIIENNEDLESPEITIYPVPTEMRHFFIIRLRTKNGRMFSEKVILTCAGVKIALLAFVPNLLEITGDGHPILIENNATHTAVHEYETKTTVKYEEIDTNGSVIAVGNDSCHYAVNGAAIVYTRHDGSGASKTSYLKVAHRGVSNWNVATVLTEGPLSTYLLALGIHVAQDASYNVVFQRNLGTYEDLLFAENSTGSWQIEGIRLGQDDRYVLAGIIETSLGVYRIVATYYNAPDGIYYLRRWDGSYGSWSGTTVYGHASLAPWLIKMVSGGLNQTIYTLIQISGTAIVYVNNTATNSGFGASRSQNICMSSNKSYPILVEASTIEYGVYVSRYYGGSWSTPYFVDFGLRVTSIAGMETDDDNKIHLIFKDYDNPTNYYKSVITPSF